MHAPGGMQQHAENLYSQFASRHYHCVEVFTTTLAEGKSGDTWVGFGGNLTVHFLQNTDRMAYGTYNSISAQSFATIHKMYPFDAIHSQSVAAQGMLEGSYQSILNTVPMACTWHGFGYEAFRSKLNMAYMFPSQPSPEGGSHADSLASSARGLLREIFLFDRIPFHIAISEQSEEDLIQVYHLSPSRVELIHNGVDTRVYAHRVHEREACWKMHPFERDENNLNDDNNKDNNNIKDKNNMVVSATPATEESMPCQRNGWRAKLHVPPEAITLGACGRLTAQKGFGLLLSVLPEVLSKWPNLHLVVAGHGQYLSLFGKYAESSSNPGHDRVHVLGKLDQTGMSDFYAGIDLLVNPTLYYQGLDLVMQESMMSGVPVISTSEGSVKKTLIPDDSVGRTFHISAARGLTKAIGDFVDNPAIIAPTGLAASSRAISMFALDTMGDNYDRHLRRLIDCTAQGNCLE